MNADRETVALAVRWVIPSRMSRDKVSDILVSPYLSLSAGKRSPI
jgi:hypothetical protein